MRILFISLITLFISCNGDVIFEQKREINSSLWNHNDEISFSFSIDDTSGHYDLVLDVEHNVDFAWENIYTKVFTIFPDEDTTETVIPINMADGMGQWEGNCKGMDCSLEVSLIENVMFPRPGEYQWIFRQHTREENLSGISGLGLKVLRSSE